jgi:hypothetical protein
MDALHEMCLCESHLYKSGLLWSATWQWRKETIHRISSSLAETHFVSCSTARTTRSLWTLSTFDGFTHSSTAGMHPFLPLRDLTFLFYTFSVCFFLCLTNLTFYLSLFNLFHFAFCILPFKLFLLFPFSWNPYLSSSLLPVLFVTLPSHLSSIIPFYLSLYSKYFALFLASRCSRSPYFLLYSFVFISHLLPSSIMLHSFFLGLLPFH